MLRRRRRKPDRSKFEAARAAFFAGAAEFAPHVTVETPLGTFLVATGDRKVGRQLFEREGIKEMKMLRRAATVLEELHGTAAIEGRTFVDVGANIGTTTVASLIGFPFGTAVSFEPDEENHRLLRANVLLNGLEERVTVVRAAVSDRVGKSELARHARNSGAHMLVSADGMAELSADFRERVIVPVTTLDECVADGTIDPARTALLWLDAQGQEGHVLLGAGTLTKRGVPVLTELYPAGLRNTGGLELLLDVASTAYDRFVDIRALRNPGQLEPALRPVSELASLASALEGERHTDVLLLR